MKISNVVISNIATFPYISDLHNDAGVSFSVKDTGNIHIFIWPNWAGKSTFLEIIQQVCSSVLFQPYTCEIERLQWLADSNTQDMIRHKPQYIHNLHENHTGVWKPSIVFLTFVLNEQDHKNLEFLYTHQEEINTLIATYSQSNFRFDYKWLEHYIPSYEQIVCKVQIDTHANIAWLLDNHAEPIEKFIYDYFVYFHLIQHCIAIHNTIDADKEHWHSLHATYAIVWSYRNLLHYDDMYTIWHDDYNRLLQTIHDNTQSSVKTAQDHLIWLLYAKKKIATYLYTTNPNATAFEIEDILKEHEVYQRIQFFCRKYLHRNLVVAPVVDQPSAYRFSLMDAYGHEYYLDDLSAGEKSMLWIICAVYWFWLKEWLLIIDEPELHLHPQLQKQFLWLIEDITANFWLQCIMTTHSSLMINDKNIKHVYRFHTDEGITHIVTPWENYNEDTSKLMQILKFTNTAKIFFVKKIIMVEWETDEYAFGYYLQYLAQNNPRWEEIAKDYEIVNINGKWWYARWKKFLRTFGIESYFIWDRDNIQDTGNQAINMHYYEKKALQHTRNWYLSKSEKYQAIIDYLKKYEPHHWQEIETMIEELYKKNIFILQQWDVEAYLGMQEKWLEETVQFFHNDFQTWLHDRNFDQERKELEYIFYRILTK